MPAQPRRKGLRRAIRQQVDHPLRVKIDGNRAVAPPLAASPIIDTQRPDRPSGGEGCRTDKTQEGAGTDWRTLSNHMTCTGFTPKIEGGTHEVVGEPHRAPGEGSDQVGQALREDLATAPADTADKPADTQVQSDPVTGTGEIGEGALIVRVDSFGAPLTEWAAGAAPGGAEREMDRGALMP